MSIFFLCLFQSTGSLGSLLVSSAALIVAVISFYFTLRNWRQSNRPLISARVTSFDSGGNMGIPLSIIVENTGNRPAKNIRLSVDNLSAFLIDNPEDPLRKEVIKCFSDKGIIPVLANGKSVSNGFGYLSPRDDSTWKVDAKFEMNIEYEDLDGTKFNNLIPVKIANDKGFAGGFWSSPS